MQQKPSPLRPDQAGCLRWRPAALAAALVGLGLGASMGSAWSQVGRLQPSLSVSTIYSQVSGRAAVNAGVEDGQFVTRVAPGLSWSSRFGRLQGSATYAVVGTAYSGQSEANDITQALSAQLRAEALEDFLFIDAQASIGEQTVNPFGLQTPEGGSFATDNTTEVRSFSLSPYIRGRVLGLADYELRWTGQWADGGTVERANARSGTTSLTLGSSVAGTRLGWNLGAISQTERYDLGLKSRTDRVFAGLTAMVDVDLTLGATLGRESTDVFGGARADYDNWGWNLRWTPTPRTDVTWRSDRRYFGNAHALSLTHRWRRSAWSYADFRGVSSAGDLLGGVGRPVTLYSIYDAAFTAQEPDPLRREALVRDYLRALGQDPSSLVGGGILNTEVTRQRRQDLGWVVQWVRSSMSLRAYRSRSSALQNNPGALFRGEVRQTGFAASWTHRLTAETSLSLLAAIQDTASNGIEEGNELRSVGLSLTHQLGRNTSGSLSLRHADYDSVTDPYREASITASLLFRF